jgi:hypothetical protein
MTHEEGVTSIEHPYRGVLYQAIIEIDGVYTYLGPWPTAEEAMTNYQQALKERDQ